MIYLRGFFPLRGDPEYEQARKVTGDNQPYWFTEERIGGYDTGGYVRQRYDDRLFAGGADMKHPDAGKGKDKDDMKGNGRKRLSASRRVTFAEGIKPNEGQWSMPDLFNFDVEPQRMTRDWSKIFLGADVPKPVQGDEGNTDGMKTQLVTEASIHSLNKSQPQKNDVVTQVQGFPPQHAVFEDKNEGSNEKQGPEDDEDHDADPEDGGEDGDMDAEKVTDEGANLHSSDQIVRN
ncbi:hypothetical protein BKA66DRAFT_460536 [Pyrenochaeta sp. MPI-SDFR-AT-0127]|nr:hypothetical protein BKA66DRAFT_460536 [Pyrenochaeta sp. MPI-SDFR-AT-0127]